MAYRDSGDRGFNGRSSGRSGGFGGRREGGFGGSRGRSSGGFGNRRPEMHDVICDKCKAECQVPFRPTGDKPVLCSDCFRKDGGASRDSSRAPRDFGGSSSSSGMSPDQFKQINAKLDKIIAFLDQIEFEDESEEGEEDEEALGEEDSEEAEEAEISEEKTEEVKDSEEEKVE